MIDKDYLPYFITEDIYLVQEHALEEPDHVVNEPEPVVPPPPKINVEKEPQAHDLAIWTPPLASRDKALLTNILNAIKKDLNTTFLMEGYDSYKPHFKTLLCFGYQKELELQAGKSIPLYSPVTIDGRTFITSVSPEELQKNTNHKKQLWTALRKHFL